MELSVDLTDDAEVEIEEVDVDIYGDTIEFSIEGEINQVSSDLLTEFIDQELTPVEITFAHGDMTSEQL